MSTEEKMQIGRLTMRVEGDNWTAYFADTDTMNDAVWLGSVKMNIIHEHPDRREAFIGLMRDAVADIIEQKTGYRPEWGGEELAPEHERSGSA